MQFAHGAGLDLDNECRQRRFGEIADIDRLD
jgi:hypothetical protein